MGYYKDLLPAMTAVNVPTPYAVQANEQVTSGLVWYAVDKNSSTYWSTNAKAPSCWFRVDFGNQVKVSRYSIAIDTAVPPTGFNLEASNTGLFSGEQVILDSQNSVVWNTNGKNQYDINNSNSYRYYRVNFTSGTYSMRVQEFEFLEYVHYRKILLSSNSKTYSVAPTVYATETAIPQMTSNTTPSGIAFASSIYGTGYEPWKAFDRNVGDYYSQNSIKTGHLGYEFSKRVVIGRYTLTANTILFAPKDWTFEGSNDGVVWTVLDTQVNQTWTANNTDKEYSIDINKTNSYKMYRLNWSSNNGGGYVIIREFKMYERIPFKLLKLSNQSEQTFMNYGMEPTINPTQFNGVKPIESNSIVHESVKTFEHTVDMSKRRVDKITLG
ncbi:hypothetical protein [Paenibacillus sp. W2I17]|uniref:galactose-binding domain-containing protein n=1 Tax=Paenibacillus sp. W2I17 TaxID=3042311 RepID=UPI00278AE324|nr:hypothetical protein [Paenibacillus sp. W2I17]MDQ0657516.1 hypothetical protein [Paenibacillus sp. W2I17]